MSPPSRPSTSPQSPASPKTNHPYRASSTATRKAAFIGWTMGVNHSTQGAVTVAAINNLALITGNIGRAGAAPFSITGQCNAMGTRESRLHLQPPRLSQV